MQRLLITLLAALFVGGVASAQAFPDIPANHWAGDAVEEIADLGIVIGFPDGTFRGNEAFTRYQAALVISRLLSVIEANADAMMGAMQADVQGMMNQLRATVQDLAGNVAAHGARLSAAESAIAGLSSDVAAQSGRIGATESAIAGISGDVAAHGGRLSAAERAIAGLGNDVASLTSRLAAIEAAAGDSAVLRDLQNQLASLRVSVDTAQAQAEAAAGRAAAAEDLALQALAGSEQNAADLVALTRAFQLLTQRFDAMGAPTPAPMPDLSGIARLEGDVENIRQFVILLRRDQVALRDRVSALEAAGSAVGSRVDALEGRVAALERSALTFSGSVELLYNAVRFGGCAGDGAACGFDVDRVYGSGSMRPMGNGRSVFSTGTSGTDPVIPAERRAEFRAAPGMSVTFKINVTGTQAFTGRGGPRGLNAFGTVAQIDFARTATDLPLAGGATGATYVMRVRNVLLNATPIGAGPLTFAFGEELSVRLTPYVFDIRKQPGFVATIGSPDFLAFLNPTLTIAYFTNRALAADAGPPAVPAFPAGFRTDTAIRGTMAPSIGQNVTLAGGVSYARRAWGTNDLDVTNNLETTVFGIDGQIGLLGLINLDFEYATSSTVAGANFVPNAPYPPAAPTPASATALYVRGSLDGSGLPIINNLRGNYRSIAPDWTTANRGIFTDAAAGGETAKAQWFEQDQTGFGVEGSLGLFILNIDAFFDSYTSTAGTVTAFGAATRIDLFAGFSLSALYEQVALGGTPANNNSANERVSRGYTYMDGKYETQIGVTLRHDGAAANALIRGLDLSVAYRMYNVGFTATDLNVTASYNLTISILSLRPYVGYRTVSGTTADYTRLSAGTSIMTETLDLGFVRASLMGAVNYISQQQAAGYTATELQWSAGVVLDQFLFGPNSSLTARYGSYTGTNTGNFWTSGAHEQAGAFGAGSTAGNYTNRGGAVTSTSGYEVEWNYFDLAFAYGMYNTSDTVLGPDRTAQQFRVAYTINFP
jgi:hypothetical protein